MKTEVYKLSAKLWIYQGGSPWHFVSIQKKDADIIKKEYIWPKRGFGSIPVNVVVGKTSWKTSIFPDKKGEYLLPIKKEVRINEGLRAGDKLKILIELIN